MSNTLTVQNKNCVDPMVNPHRITVEIFEQCQIDAPRQLGQPKITCVVFEVFDGEGHSQLVYAIVKSNVISVQYKVNRYSKHDPGLCLRLKLFIETATQKIVTQKRVTQKIVTQKRMKIRLSYLFPSHILLGYKFSKSEFTREIQHELKERGYDIKHHSLVRSVCCGAVLVDSDFLEVINDQLEESIKHPRCIRCNEPFPIVSNEDRS